MITIMGIDIQQYEEGTDIRFGCDSKSITGVLEKAKKLINPTKATSFLSFGPDNMVYLICYNGPVFLSIRIHGIASKGTGCFTVEPTELLGVIKNRSKLVFKFNGDKLKFRNKQRYKGELAVSRVAKDVVSTCNQALTIGGDRIPISDSLWTEIRKGINVCSISDVHNKEGLVRFISIRDGLLTIASYDQYHMVYFEKKVESEANFSLAVNTEYFSIIEKVLGASNNVRLIVNENIFYIHYPDDDVSLVQPPLQSKEEGYTLPKVYIDNIYAGVNDMKTVTKLTIDRSQLSTMIGNLTPIAETGSKILITPSENELAAEIKTSKSSVSDTLVVKVSGLHIPFTIDPPTISDIINTMPPGLYELNAVLQPLDVGGKKKKTINTYIIKQKVNGEKLIYVGVAN